MNYSQVRENIQSLRKQAQEAAKEAIAQGANELFQKFPEMESFGWRQYTPYFNDGDTCTFSACTDDPTINGEESIYKGYKGGKGENEELIPARDGVREFLQVFDDEDLLAVFGDHTEVTIHRDGQISTDEYEHD